MTAKSHHTCICNKCKKTVDVDSPDKVPQDWQVIVINSTVKLHLCLTCWAKFLDWLSGSTRYTSLLTDDGPFPLRHTIKPPWEDI